MNLLDLVLILVVIAYAVAGFRQGFLIGALGMVGLLSGGMVGVWLAPIILEEFEPSITVSLSALGGVIILALVGQTIGSVLGAKLRARVRWRPAHVVDAGAGALLSAAAVLVVAWILGAAVAGSQLGAITPEVRDSRVLATVDRVMPERANQALFAFGQVVDPGLFPRFMEPFAPERILPVDPPDAGVLRDPDVAQAAASVVKVNGVAQACSRSLAGSGFVYAEDRVMTNAHVVAGVRSPTVLSRDGGSHRAEVVHYDPQRDIAVLAVPDLDVPALDFDRGAETGDSAVVMGYPGNGDFTAGPARIRSEQPLRGPDIYGSREVTREVLSLYATVRQGNSGGPLMSPAGDVIGLIFAASVEDSSTGYALTVEELSAAARAGAAASDSVGTGSCA